MQSAPSLRLRLVEPNIGVVSGGTRVVLHGVGFRPPPHSLTVRWRVDLEDSDVLDDSSKLLHVDTNDQLSWTGRLPVSNAVDVSGRFLVGTQIECVLPNFELQAKHAIAARTSLAASSASVSSAPQLVPLSVEVIVNGGEQRSNALTFKLHQPLEIRRVCPQSVLMASPAVLCTMTLNILQLPAPILHPAICKGGQMQLNVLEELSALPVFVRVRQTSERTGGVSEQTRAGKWKLSSVGIYEVEFEAVTMGFGAASVGLSLNRVDFFHCRSDASPEAYGYRVNRDVILRALEPACISVTSGQVTEMRLMGDGFVDTGDIVVALLQKELPVQLNEGDTAPKKAAKEIQVAQLNATYYGKNEVRCMVPANLQFGCTSFCVSLNGGRQFGQARIIGLLYRDRMLEEIIPESSSLAGGTPVMLRYGCLTLDGIDAFYQLQRLHPPRRIRVRFQPVSYSNVDGDSALAKVVTAEASPETPGILHCKTPSFLEDLTVLNGMRTAETSGSDGEKTPYIWKFTVAVELGGDSFHGALRFSFYLPPVIRSLTQHHGPSTGDTCVKLRMKHKVPSRIKLLVRFSTLDFTKSTTVEGHSENSNKSIAPDVNSSQSTVNEDPEYVISCHTPPWLDELTGNLDEVPHLTIVQVSFDVGVTFFPAIDEPPTATHSNPLAKDLSYLYFLYYPPPIVHTAIPLSADILGGSYIRFRGENLVDHGAKASVIFQSTSMSRKVDAFIEKGELRCCAPQFNVGLARVFVSLNNEQYKLCELYDPETKAPLEFIFYSSPIVTQISPQCASVRQSSELKIFGTNLVETERIKVRVRFPANAHGSSRRLLYRDVPGTARDGVITAITPIFPDEYAGQNAHVDVALNGTDFSGACVPLHYFLKYKITRVEPPLGAFEVPVTLKAFLLPAIVTDKVFVRIRLEANNVEHETSEMQELIVVHGPVEACSWTATNVEFMIPPLSTLVDNLSRLITLLLDISFDGVHFHGVGDLREHYQVYNMPQLTSATPLFGLSDRETKVVAHGVHMKSDDVVKLKLFLESTIVDNPKAKVKGRRRAAPVPFVTVTAEVNVKRQRLSWTCPSLIQLRASPDREFAPLVAAAPVITNGIPDRRTQNDVVGGMLLAERVIIQISVVEGQPTPLPFVFRYYRAPALVDMNPRVGYACSGSLVSFEFAERIATPTVDFRFGESLPMSGRIRDERFVECFSPELTAGSHNISVSFNEQHFEPVVLVERHIERPTNNKLGSSCAATFQAFALPVFVLPPARRERVYAFGSISGGTIVVIKGKGFVPDTKIYVRFVSEFNDAFEGKTSIIVSAKVVDDETIKCISPPSRRLGRTALHVSYNLQQFSDSTCFFEYHAPTRYVPHGTLCGPISGQAHLKLFVEDSKGLPSFTQLLECVVRFESEKKDQDNFFTVDVDAQYDPDTRILSCISPSWSSNELVSLQVSLSRGDGELFEDTRIKFLFYDPPDGVIKIEPAAGPITGGTEVLVWCGSIVETGEMTVSIQLYTTKDPSSAPLSNSPSKQSARTIIVRGDIVGEAVKFVAPRVEGPCTAVLSISLNGINYTSTQSPLHFMYYVEPILRRINPGWAAVEGANDDLVIEGEHIRDFGCELLVRFVLQDEKQPDENGIVVRAQFISNSTVLATGDGALLCVFPAASPGFYELEVSLNGQQFSHSLYVSKTFGNLSGTACTALLPFRYFSSPFCLATATGPAAGGSTVVLFLGGKILKMLSRESKCQVQFSPVRGLDRILRLPSSNPTSGISPIKGSPIVAPETICMVGEIDHVKARVACRAPLLRVGCVSVVDILLPNGSGISSACQLFGLRQSEREKYYSYESPSITEIAPTCGPTSGGTQLVIEGANILDTAQIFVRFRSSVNERECVLVPARYSRIFPGGSASASPLIICNTPSVEFIDKTTSCGVDSAMQSTSYLPPQSQPSSRARDGATAGKARTQTYQMLAEQSLKVQRASVAHGGIDCELTGLDTLRITRPSFKATPRGNAETTEGGVTVLVDFTLNAGEQFIAHSVRFHYYQDIEPRQVKWSPRHLPIQCLSGRQATDSRLLTVSLPKTFKLMDYPERVCFRFDGIDFHSFVAKRRSSSIVLHETDSRTELVIRNPPKIQKQSTMRRPSTYFQNSTMYEGEDLSMSQPITPRSERGGTSLSSRRAAFGADGMLMTVPATPDADSPHPATAGSSPCFVGKVINSNEVTCSVPEFSSPGAVKVFFSLNAQEFVCLGELLFHSMMTIREEFHRTTFRFCSNVGGSPFALQCSPSTVLNYLASEDVTTAEKKHVQIRNLGLRKCSTALEGASPKIQQITRELEVQTGSTIREDDVESNSDQEDEDKNSTSNKNADEAMRCGLENENGAGRPLAKEPFQRWKTRSFHTAQVFLVPANAKLLQRTMVSATRVDNQHEAEKIVPDDGGCCAFDMSNWSEEMLLSVALPASCGYSSYSSVIKPGKCSLSKTHLVVPQLPVSGKIHVAVIGSSAVELRVVVIDSSGNEFTPDSVIHSESEVYEDTRIYLTLVDHPIILESGCDVCYMCIRFSAISNDIPNNTSIQDEANIQVLVSDSNGIQICLCGPPVESAVWIVGRLQVEKFDPGASTGLSQNVEAVDILVQGVQEPIMSDSLALKEALTNIVMAPKLSKTTASQPYTVPVTFVFTSTDSTRSITTSSRARLILSDSDNLQTLLACSLSPPIRNGPTVTLECSMPPLSLNGPATLTVNCGGVIFSNSVMVQCYDPRSWRVIALSPPCGQLPIAQKSKESQELMTFRIKGEHFVENRKIIVRVSDKDRYFLAPGKIDQVHMLSLRIAAVKNLRHLLQPLGIVPQGPNAGSTGASTHKKDDNKYLSSIVGGTTAGGSVVALSTWSTFVFTLRIECGDQKLYASCRETSVLSAIAPGSVLSWEEEFEVRVASDRRTPLLLTAELSEPSLPKPLELAQAWVPLNGIQEGSSEIRRYTAKFEEHFKRGNFVGSEAVGISSAATEVDLLLQLSPLMLHTDYIVAQVPYPLLQELAPQFVGVQVSSGDGFYSAPHSFVIYKSPTVTKTTPNVLPRSAGGDIVVSGTGFVNSSRVCVRLFAFKKNHFKNNEEEQRALATINRVKKFQRTKSTNDGFFPYFSRDVEGTFISSTSLKFRMPSYLTSYNVYYSISFDGRSFSETTPVSSVLLFSVNAVTPKGGPISGNTYTTLYGTNIESCLSQRSGRTSIVRVTWKRGARDLEHVIVPGEFYPHEDAIYFYSPQSKFGLHSIAVNVELALVNLNSSGADMIPRFSRDEVSFVMYKTPTIKSVAPLTALVPGLSTTEIIVQGFEEKAVSNLKLEPKFRFKRRGQMQLSDAFLVSESRFDCVVPRFNVTNAAATDLPLSVLSGFSPIQKHRTGGNQGALSPRRSNTQPKLWTRTAGIFVVLLGARNLRASKKNACNPFAVVYVGKTQLKSTRKDGMFSPVWNELFDFEWASGSAAFNLPTVRVVFENQLTADQSESLGHVELKFPITEKQLQPFSLRAWLPLRRIRGKYARKEDEVAKSRKTVLVPAAASVLSLGEVELAIAFVPHLAPPKKHKTVLRSSIISVMSTQPLKQTPGPNRRESGQVMTLSRKEKLLRAFRQRGAPVSLVPTELTVELALNGQDFWSVAPSSCYSVLTPIVIDVEPKFICIDGGSLLHISGNNFINSSCLRVAFAVLTDDGITQTLGSERTVVVEAKYRSSTSLVCTAPSLLHLASEASYVNIYVSLNGTDFDSIALPRHLTQLNDPSERPVSVDDRVEENDETVNEEPLRKSPLKNTESDNAVTLVCDQYVIDCKKLISWSRAEFGGVKAGNLASTRLTSTGGHGNFLLVPQIRVYWAPKITRVRPTDGVYTSHLTFEGKNFTNTGIAIARFTSQSVNPEIHSAKLNVISSTHMECSVPDFPRGVIVRVTVAMNGVEFVQCPGELRVFQSPRLTELFPNWVSTSTTVELELRGINLTAAVSTKSSGDNNRNQHDSANIQVSFTGTRGKKVVRGKCEGGHVRCLIPREILYVSTTTCRDKGRSHSATTTIFPIQVDIWLGGKHNAFTGLPLPLHVYGEIPAVHIVSPMDGPVYGGFSIVVEGNGFIDTGKIVVRFQLYTDHQETPRTEDDNPETHQVQDSSTSKSTSTSDVRQKETTKDNSASEKNRPRISMPSTQSIQAYVDVIAKFVSSERVLCPAPSLPQEGVYAVLVALNSVEFSRVSDGSWYLAWQNWQKRKRLLSHSLFSRATAPDEIASALSSASLDEDNVDRLRRKSSFMLPKIRSALAVTPGGSPSTSSRVKRDSVAEDIVWPGDTEEMLMKKPQLLQWHPTSSMESRVNGRPLLPLLEYLCSARETQQFICRRLHVAFRLTSPHARDGNGSADAVPAVRYCVFVEAIRMIFPNAMARDLEELWQATDHRPDGTTTVKQLLRRLTRNVGPDHRSKSPEPGPTHYDPRYKFVSSREPSAIIFPPVVQPEHIVDPPSALFIDYDAATLVVKPRPPRHVFRKRKFNTSWCNPVVDAVPRSPTPPSVVNRPRQSLCTRVEDFARISTSETTATVTDTATTNSSDSDVNRGRQNENTNEPPTPSTSNRTKTPQQIETSKQDAVRTPRTLAQATFASSNQRTRSPNTQKSTRESKPLTTPTPSPAIPANTTSRQSNLSGQNPFYNDIAPLYAKFLSSTEVKRFLNR